MKKLYVIGGLVAFIAKTTKTTKTIVGRSNGCERNYSLPSQLLDMIWDDAEQYKKDHPEDPSSLTEVFSRFYKKAKDDYNNARI